MTSTTPNYLTLAEYLSLPDVDFKQELVEGKLVTKMSPKRFHSRLTLVLAMALEEWNNGQGEVGIEWAISLQRNRQDWCPIPDLLYISYQRLGDIPLTDEPCPVAPELVIEIISPDQSFSSLSEKAVAYLTAGVQRVWLVDPRAKQITIFYPDAPPKIKKEEDDMSDVLFPNLVLTVQKIFAGIP